MTSTDPIRSVLDGQLDRFEELIAASHESVWRCVAGIGLDRETTRDVVQEAFVEAYRQIDTFDPDKDFGAWVRGIGRNLARKEIRRRSCHYRHQERYRQHISQRFEKAEEPDERLAALRRCRERLNPDARAVIDRYYAEDQPIDGIAASLKRSAAATKQLLWRARMALRKCIEAQPEVAT